MKFSAIIKSLFVGLILITFLSTDAIAQQQPQVVEEVENKPDGIVFPRIDTAAVNSPVRGQVVYDDVDNTLYQFDGSFWNEIGSYVSNEFVDEDGDTGISTFESTTDSILMDIDGDTKVIVERNRIQINHDGGSMHLGEIEPNITFNSMGGENTFLGFATGQNNMNGNSNVFVGLKAGQSNTDGSENTFIGRLAGQNNDLGTNNTYVGNGAGFFNKGKNNVLIGEAAGAGEADWPNMTSSFNETTLIGVNAGASNTANGTIAIGKEAGRNNTGAEAIIIGANAGVNNEGGFATLVGYQAGQNNKGDGNTLLGYNAGYNPATPNQLTGGDNVFVGTDSGQSNTTGLGNTFLGRSTGRDNTTGNENTFVGGEAGQDNTSGLNNTFIGQSAGYLNETGENNVYIGRNAGAGNKSGSNSIIIGTNAGSIPDPIISQLIIDNSNTATPLIHGDFFNDELTIHGNLKVDDASGTGGTINAKTANLTDFLLLQPTSTQPAAVDGTVYFDGTDLWIHITNQGGWKRIAFQP